MRKPDYKWTALILLWVAFFLQQGTRQVYGPLLGSIQASLGASDVQVGLVSTVFTLVYGLAIPFAGFLADLFSRKWMVVVGVTIFSLGILTSGLVSCIGVLVITYGLVNGFDSRSTTRRPLPSFHNCMPTQRPRRFRYCNWACMVV